MVGQVFENGRTRIAWSLFKKGCTMIGILQNGGVFSEIFIDVVFSFERDRIIVVNEKMSSKNL